MYQVMQKNGQTFEKFPQLSTILCSKTLQTQNSPSKYIFGHLAKNSLALEQN